MSKTITMPVRFAYNPKPLVTAMKALGLTQNDLARESGKHFVTISRVLNEGPASPEILEWLCRRLGVPQSEVIGPPETPSFLPSE